MSPVTSSTRPLGPDEAEALRVHVEPADDQVHAVGQAVVAAAGLDERAGRDEMLEPAAERGPLLLRDLEELQQLPHGRGVVDPLPHQAQNLVIAEHR